MSPAEVPMRHGSIPQALGGCNAAACSPPWAATVGYATVGYATVRDIANNIMNHDYMYLVP